jgi:hypothetical protein
VPLELHHKLEQAAKDKLTEHFAIRIELLQPIRIGRRQFHDAPDNIDTQRFVNRAKATVERPHEDAAQRP